MQIIFLKFNECQTLKTRTNVINKKQKRIVVEMIHTTSTIRNKIKLKKQ